MISVIMPIYNNKIFLKDSIDSIVNQSFKDWELIICDDGSKEPIYEILNSYNDERIKIYSNKENKGTPKTLNFCLDMSKGDYIARQDSDDISMPNRLEEQVKLFVNGVGVVSTYGKAIDSNGNILKNNYTDNTIRVNPSMIKNEMLESGGNRVLGPAAMFSREVFNKIGYYDEEIGCGAEDTNYWLRAFQFFDYDVVKEDLFYYRINPNSMRLWQKDKFGNGPKGKVKRRKWIFERSKTHTIIKERHD